MAYRFDFSLILPCYNEGEHFVASVDTIVDTLDRTDLSWEVIFVEDYSKDNTRDLIHTYIAKHKRKHFSVIYHKRNAGRGQSVMDGILRARGKIVGYIDIDIEIPAEYIPRFVQAIDDGNHVASGWRVYDFTFKSLPRWIASKGYSMVRNKALGTAFKDTEAGYKFFRRSAIVPIAKNCRSRGWFWDTEIMVRASRSGLRIKEIPVVFIRRFDKTSTVRLIPDTLTYLKELWRFKNRLIAS